MACISWAVLTQAADTEEASSYNFGLFTANQKSAEAFFTNGSHRTPCRWIIWINHFGPAGTPGPTDDVEFFFRRSDMEMFWYDLKPIAMLSTVIYSVIGLVVFAVSLFIMNKVTPFSIAKEIGEDQNTALAIIIGSVFISLAIIIQAAIRG
jgi:putative membrane protein